MRRTMETWVKRNSMMDKSLSREREKEKKKRKEKLERRIRIFETAITVRRRIFFKNVMPKNY